MVSKRKLAAILFTDIVGYSRQVSLDETRSLQERVRVERLIRDCAASHHGRVIKTIGDAVMIEFGSAVDAVSCAITIQERMQELNVDLDSNTPLQVRVGVHVGDVVEEDNDLFGNAVNIAQRIQDMAAPGGICISREVYVQIRPILKLRCDVVTTGSRKPMPEPVEVLTVTNDLLGPPSEARSDKDRTKALLLWSAAPVLSVFLWCLTEPLWNWGEGGPALSGVVVGIAVIAFCRLLTEYVPELRADDSYRKRSLLYKAVRLAPLLIFFAIGVTILSQAYISALDHYTFLGWGFKPGPWSFADDNKGQEYRLLIGLKAFQGNTQQVTLDSYNGGSWNSADRLAGMSTLVPILFALAFILSGVTLAMAAGHDKNFWKNNPLAVKKLNANSLGVSAWLFVLLGFIWLWRDCIFSINGSQPTGTTMMCRGDADTVAKHLEAWFSTNGYVIPAFEKYRLDTVPQMQPVGKAYVYRAWKPDSANRWRFHFGPVESLSPFLSVQCISSDKPAETRVMVDEVPVKPGTAASGRLKATFDSLDTAFADIRE